MVKEWVKTIPRQIWAKKLSGAETLTLLCRTKHSNLSLARNHNKLLAVISSSFKVSLKS